MTEVLSIAENIATESVCREHCDKTHNHHNNTAEDSNPYLDIPSVEFFKNQFANSAFSFPFYGCVLVVWTGVAFALYNSTETIGKIFRYCLITLVTLLIIIFSRMIFLPGALATLRKQFFKPISDVNFEWFFYTLLTPMLSFTSFGPGWATVLSMASYNKFKTNIAKSSFLISLFQLGIIIMVGLLCSFTEYHLTQNSTLNSLRVNSFSLHWTSFLSIPSSLATMEYSHFWTWMFLAMLTIGGINLVITQLFSILTAVFDEFEKLRSYRKEVIFGTAAIMALITASLCTQNITNFTEIIVDINIISHAFINFLLLIIVLWIYGRERFQRDVEFMTSQVLASWKVYTIKFVTPFFLGITLFIAAVTAMYNNRKFPYLPVIGGVLGTLLWVILPIYCVFRLMQTTGTLGLRFKRCSKPIDWFPVSPEDRQEYEETVVDSPETSHPLTTII